MDMHELVRAFKDLQAHIQDMGSILHLDDKRSVLAQLQQEMNDEGFWQDAQRAKNVSKKASDIQSVIDTWELLHTQCADAVELADLDESGGGGDLRADLEQSYTSLKKQAEELEFLTLFFGKHDENNAIVSFHAGAGGTEAQDWASMLLRMVLRFVEKKGWKADILDESSGTEAGIKSATARITGDYVYGHLKSEHGTHRLVRISPFDAEKMRHTSFANIEVIPEIQHDTDLDIDPKDLRIDTFMASGKGGQSVNTTYSAVRIVHEPTGITVQCQNERSQLQNKDTAMRILQSRLQLLKEEEEEKERQKLRGEHKQAAWGNQIRSYVLHPYTLVKDTRTKHERQDPDTVLDGDLDSFIESYLRWSVQKR
jgi:peptide chain release factor 2